MSRPITLAAGAGATVAENVANRATLRAALAVIEAEGTTDDRETLVQWSPGSASTDAAMGVMQTPPSSRRAT